MNQNISNINNNYYANIINYSKVRQKESIISPDGITILMNSVSIETLYLENCGLIDDHVDTIRDEVTL